MPDTKLREWARETALHIKDWRNGIGLFRGYKTEADIIAEAGRELIRKSACRDLSVTQVMAVFDRCKCAESALAEAQELLGVMYGWAKYGEESDHWYYSEEQAPGWKADSERASKLLGFKLKAKP